MQEFTREDLFEFKKLTKKNIRQFFVNYVIFYENDYKSIENFYEGKIKEISSEPFKNFYKIKTECSEILSLFSRFSKEFTNIKWIYIIEYVENINDRLLTLNKINKWCRSSKSFSSYSQIQKQTYVMSQFDNLEKIAKNMQNSTNQQDDWYLIAVQNNLKEEDYTSEGGQVLSVDTQNQNSSSAIISSVVDIINENTILGKDINRTLSYDNEKNDLSVLSPNDTIEQAILILVTLKKNDNPDFPNNGLQSEIIIGQNRNLMNFPILTRQLNETFSNDDTLVNFSVNNFSFEEDNMFLDFSVENRLSEVKELQQQL